MTKKNAYQQALLYLEAIKAALRFLEVGRLDTAERILTEVIRVTEKPEQHKSPKSEGGMGIPSKEIVGTPKVWKSSGPNKEPGPAQTFSPHGVKSVIKRG